MNKNFFHNLKSYPFLNFRFENLFHRWLFPGSIGVLKMERWISDLFAHGKTGELIQFNSFSNPNQSARNDRVYV